MEERQPRKLAVILHADVVGSTTLVQKNESLAHARIQDAFRRFSSTIEAYNGVTHELRGDALVAEFARASDAVAAALAFQIENTESNARLEDDLQPRLRIGISLGEVVIADNTVTGAGVVLAQRVEQLAEPGGVCITGAIHEAVPQYLPLDYSDLGKREAKGFEEPVQVYSASVKAGKQVPPPEPAVSAGAKSRKSKRRWAASAIVLLILVVGGLAWWQPWNPREEPASVERMAFPLPDMPSIAVLPFGNLSGDPEQEYFSDGITNDIITDLAKFRELFVIASNSTFTYKGKAVDVRQVSRDLGVQYVLEGSVQRSEGRVRINAQLVDATTGHHLWAERYDRDAKSLFAVQDEIVETIASTLAVKVHATERERATRKDTDSLEAYDYYLQGRDRFPSWSKEESDQAKRYFEKAIDLDPRFSRAYAYLAVLHVNDWRWGWSDTPEVSKKLSLEFAQRASALDSSDSRSHSTLGLIYLHERQFDRAMAEYERALALNPNDVDFRMEMAEALVMVGRHEEGIELMKQTMRLSPMYPDWFLWDLGWAYYLMGRYEQALAEMKRMKEVPYKAHRTFAAIYAQLGRIEEATAQAAEYLKHDPDYTMAIEHMWPYKNPEDLEHLLDGYRKAGLPE
jgi:adenylate cyclase